MRLRVIGCLTVVVCLLAAPALGDAQGRKPVSFVTGCFPTQVLTLVTDTGSAPGNLSKYASPFGLTAYAFDWDATPQYFAQSFIIKPKGNNFAGYLDTNYVYVSKSHSVSHSTSGVGPPPASDVSTTGVIYRVDVIAYPPPPPYTQTIIRTDNRLTRCGKVP